MTKQTQRSPWWWVPSLYYAEGIPYAVVMLISVIFYKRMGISNTDIALYTSWLYLPWVIKPLWSPVVDILRTKRWWIIITQLIIGAGLGGVALSVPLPTFFKMTLGFLWLLAFSSATHDIAADGFYMLGLNKHQQAWFVGIRSTFYRFAMITGQGLLIILAGMIESNTGLDTLSLQAEAISDSTFTKQEIVIDTSRVQLVADPPILQIPLTKRSKTDFDLTIDFVKEWNNAQGQTKNGNGSQSTNNSSEQKVSSWSRIVSTPLENFIKKHFGATVVAVPDDDIGNFGIIRLRLSAKPDRETVVNLGRVSGDKSLSLITAPRIVFNETNWDKPVLAVIQVDHKLKHPASATFEARSGNIKLAWSITFFIIGALFVIFFIYHKFILPYPADDKPSQYEASFMGNFWETFASYFKKDKIGLILAFILIYRFGEAQLVKLAVPFMLDAQEAGGLALTTGQVGFVYGTIGMVMLTLGGIIGGFLAAKHGLKYWILWMALAMKLPDVVYVIMSYTQPDSFLLINVFVAIEQFGYGFGFTAYMLYMISVAEGKHKTAHYAICTGFMALGMMIPGMFSGWLQEIIGYQHFFIWVLIATIPGLLLIKFLPLNTEFGKKES